LSEPSPDAPGCEEALALCARDAGVDRQRLRVLRVARHYKSRQVYVSAGEPTPSHVIKLNDMAWSPEREHAGYAYLERAVANASGAAGERDARLGAIRPVGFSEDPAFLVTAFQPGLGVRPVFDAATGWRSSAAVARAAEARARDIAAWSARTRAWEPEHRGGRGPDRLIEDLRRHVAEIALHLGRRAGSRAAGAIGTAERMIAAMSPAEREPLCWRFATHGDLAPQNFLVGPDGRIYALDLENFQLRDLHLDLSMFRSRLETYALRGPIPRRRARDIWTAFLDETRKCAARESEAFRVLAYLQRLLAHLAWLRDPEYLARQRPDPSPANRLRQWLWLRNRLAWLHDLPDDPAEAIRHYQHVL
jgi:hypothetical protein